MLWYILLCFSSPTGEVCGKAKMPTYEICMLAETTMRQYAVIKSIEADIECVKITHYT